jgi:antirestriction protein ArdC
MPSTKVARSRFTEQQRAEYKQQKRSEQREQVERAVQELLTSDGWTRWAQTRATFHRYSMGNCMLIAMQRPDASQVAGFRKWQELGRQVRKGERSIKIMAPMSVKRENAETGEEERTTFFRSVPVFDLAQTDGEPLPEPPCEPITGDSHFSYIGKLEVLARTMGLTVEYRPLDTVGGYYSESEQKIVVSTNVGCANAHVRVLVHELAHAHGVTYKDYSRGEAEVIVETAATIVCGSLGLDTSGESIPYIAGWGESGDLDAIRKHAETVDTIARTLEVACGLGGAS